MAALPSPSAEFSAGVSEEDGAIPVDIQVIGKENGSPFHMSRQKGGCVAVAPDDGEPEVSVGDVEVAGPFVESKAERSAAQMLEPMLLSRRRLDPIRTYLLGPWANRRFKRIKNREENYLK